ncbi:LAMI_0B08614g1_1 [Lachancea mirantina]|uniref:LAMI_0B08614g1_1 n=1 Tax=Lachancea mirantina TaxID=1230905 RepID=A0A1G4IXZ7_9SACH|nr:LAMI_0B08614g1_1 [Lachancea mirantina]
MTELIVLTCASGRQCSGIIPLLYGKPSYLLRLVVNSTSSLQRLSKQWPAAEVVQANLRSPDDCSKILHGATAIVFIGPPYHPYEVTLGMNMIDAAVEETKTNKAFKHFIFSSAIHPELSKMLNHTHKRPIEEYLTESGLSYTILQPSTFMDNFIGVLVDQAASSAHKKGLFKATFNPNTPMSFSTVRDLADIVVKVITERARHFYATYQIVATFPITTTEFITQVGEALGIEFEIQQMPFEQACEIFTKSKTAGQEMDQQYKDGPERMLIYYNSRGLYGNPGVAEWLLGRPATSPADLALAKLKERSQ